MARFRAALVLTAVGFLTTTTPASAAFINGGFESSDFTGWTTTGNTSVVGTNVFNNGTNSFLTSPTEGSFQAFLTTAGSGASGSDIATFLGVDLATLSAVNTGGGLTNGSAIRQTVTVSAGDVLTFDWRFMAGDYSGPWNDFGFYTVSQGTGGTASFLSDIATVGDYNATAYNTQSITFTTGGTFTIGVGIFNRSDTNLNSGLYVDNFPSAAVTSTPVPATALAAFVGLAGLVGVRRRRVV